MEESSRKSVIMKPMTLAELMLTGLLSTSEVPKYSARKQPKQPQRALQSTSKDFKPYPVLTLAQLQAETQYLRPKVSPARTNVPQSLAKRWNTSTKCDNKHVSITAGINKKLTARKVLDFQQQSSKHMASGIPQASMKPAFLLPQAPKQKQSKKTHEIANNAKNLVRISGICNIQDTPACTKNPNTENKENIRMPSTTLDENHGAFDESFRQLTCYKKPLPTPRINSIMRKSMAAPVLKTRQRQNVDNTSSMKPTKPQQNAQVTTNAQLTDKSKKKIQMSKLSREIHGEQLLAPPSGTSPTNSVTNDQSFIEREKNIYRETVRETFQQNQESHIVSTPFKCYRKVEEYFNESTKFDSWDSKPDVTLVDRSTSLIKLNVSSCQLNEVSDINALCDLLDGAQITNNDITSDNFINEIMKIKAVVERDRENIICMFRRNKFILNSVNKILKSIEKSKEIDSSKKSATNPRRLSRKSHASCEARVEPLTTVQKSFIRRLKSPSYTIPKRSPCLRKRAICKSMPLDLNQIPPVTPPVPLPRSKSAAMYMKMKEQCNFLVTPMVNKTVSITGAANTPAVTSNNLQSQLQRLYDETP